MPDDFEQNARALAQEVQRLLAERRALQTKVEALRDTEHELAVACAHLQEERAQQKKEIDYHTVAKKFVEFVETRLDNVVTQLNGKSS